MDKITVIIPTWNEIDNLKKCIEKIKKYNSEAKLIVVDNGSTDETNKWLEQKQMDYIYFDEGIQEYGKIFNAVIENFMLEENVVFVWPHVLIGHNTLYEMINTLYSENDIGVVGCCSKNKPYEQNVELNSYEDVLIFEDNIKLNTKKRDCKVIGSNGYCFAMKRELFNTVGLFDENLAYMDVFVDYQLRAIKADYKNMVSRKAYVYEVEQNQEYVYWINNLRHADRNYLRKKWNTNYFMLSSNHKFNSMIGRSKEEKFAVLEVGCDMGANLLGIKNEYINCDIYGLEINNNSVEIGKHMADIRYGNVEEEKINFGVQFDYIIFGDVLEHLHNPQQVVRYCRKLLKENGRIIASIPNLMHISVMKQLLQGEFRYTDVGLLDKTHIHFFTFKEIIRMFEAEDYEIEKMEGIVYEFDKCEEQLLEQLMHISGEGVTEEMYRTYQYSVVARKH